MVQRDVLIVGSGMSALEHAALAYERRQLGGNGPSAAGVRFADRERRDLVESGRSVRSLESLRQKQDWAAGIMAITHDHHCTGPLCFASAIYSDEFVSN